MSILMLILACRPQVDGATSTTLTTGVGTTTATTSGGVTSTITSVTTTGTTETTKTTETTTTGPVETGTVTFDVSDLGAAEGAALAVSVCPWLIDGDEAEIADAVAGGAVEDGVATLEIPEPGADQLFQFDPRNMPEAWFAIFWAGVHTDDAEDGELNDDDGYVGLGEVVIVFIDGALPPELDGLGWEIGWNAWRFDDEEDLPEIFDIDAVPISVNLWPNVEVFISGDFDAEEPEDAEMGLAVLASQVWEGAVIADPYLVHEMPWEGDDWEIHLEEPPPDDHFFSENGMTMAWEVPLVYADVDASQGLSGGDELVSYICHDDSVVTLAYLRPPSELMTAIYFGEMGITSGWWAIINDEEEEQMPQTELTDLSIDASCGEM